MDAADAFSVSPESIGFKDEFKVALIKELLFCPLIGRSKPVVVTGINFI